MKKRSIALLVTMVMLVGLFSACAAPVKEESGVPSSGGGETVAPSGESTENTNVYDGVTNFIITPEPATIRLFYAFGGNGAPTGDMPVWQRVAETTGVSMENVANESISDELQSLNTMLASGSLPDLIQGMRANISPLLSQGAFIPLDDLISEYAPNIQKFLENYPDARRAGSYDGKIYTITGTLGGDPGKTVPSMGFFIRQDWLEALDLEVPTTLEEYRDVLYAFRNNDPNGNGKKDEVPYFYRDTGLWGLFQLWGAYPEWYVGDDNMIHFGRAEEEYRNAIKELSQWYADGIIDPEIFTRGSQARQILLGNNTGGSTMDWFASTGAVNDTVRAEVPGINFVAIAPPADVNGVVKQNNGRESIHNYTWGISKDCADPVTAIRFMDFFFSEPGRMLMGFGIEGEDYTMENGIPVLTEAALSNPAGYPNHLRSIGAGYEIGSYGNLEGELSSMNKQAREGFELYEASNWIQPPFPTLSFTEEEQRVIDSHMTNIKAHLDEFEQSCLLNVKDVEAEWGNHLATLESMGLNKVVEVYNSAYARYKSEL